MTSKRKRTAIKPIFSGLQIQNDKGFEVESDISESLEYFQLKEEKKLLITELLKISIFSSEDDLSGLSTEEIRQLIWYEQQDMRERDRPDDLDDYLCRRGW